MSEQPRYVLRWMRQREEHERAFFALAEAVTLWVEISNAKTGSPYEIGDTYTGMRLDPDQVSDYLTRHQCDRCRRVCDEAFLEPATADQPNLCGDCQNASTCMPVTPTSAPPTRARTTDGKCGYAYEFEAGVDPERTYMAPGHSLCWRMGVAICSRCKGGPFCARHLDGDGLCAHCEEELEEELAQADEAARIAREADATEQLWLAAFASTTR